MTALRRREALALTGALALALRPSGAAQGQSSILLRGAGATFPAPLYARWIEAFSKDHPEVTIEYDSVGSGEGISRFVTGSVDFAGSDAVISDAQMAQVTAGVRPIPATAGMVVLAYNLPGVSGRLRLGRDVYPAILNGDITSWSDPAIAATNPGLELPKRTIALVARLDGSGTTYALSNHLSAVSPAWQAKHGVGTRVDWLGTAMLMKGNEGVAGRLAITEGGLGYVEYGFAKMLGLPTAELQNQAGNFVAPTAAAGREALASAALEGDDLRVVVPDPASPMAYPVVTYSWLLLYGTYQAAKLEPMRAFVQWGLGEGQKVAEEMGYIPLPESMAAAAARSLDLIS